MKTFKSSKEEIRYEDAVKRMKQVKAFYVHLTVYLVVNLMFTFFISWGSGRFLFNSIWLWWGLGLLFQAYFTFGQNLFFSKAWKERKIKEIMDKENNQR